MGLDPKLEAYITEWNSLKESIAVLDDQKKPLYEREMELRRLIVAQAFPPGVGKEGTNKFELPHGWELKAVIGLERTVDIAVLDSVTTRLEKIGVSVDNLLRWEPEVKVREMRQLTAEQLKIFEEALTIKPKAPTLELIPPKEDK
jgi:hypothetical protein